LQLQALVFVRPGELRLAEWSEFDLDGAEWRIPGPRMKMREHHIVPLSKQALAVLQALNPVTGPEGHVFPQMRNASRPISNNTLNAALRTLGFAKSEATAHGFRSTASTMLNEFGIWHPDAIERQLAHGERNKVRSAYNSAQHLPERRRMMQAWADYLDTLRAGAIKVAA
jgi:integrase